MNSAELRYIRLQIFGASANISRVRIVRVFPSSLAVRGKHIVMANISMMFYREA